MDWLPDADSLGSELVPFAGGDVFTWMMLEQS